VPALSDVEIFLAVLAVLGAGLGLVRLIARGRRRYCRLLVEPYRGDRTHPPALLATMAALHALLAVRGPRRVLAGQPSVALEVHLHFRDAGAPLAWIAVCLPRGLELPVQAALRASYPNCAVRPVEAALSPRVGIIRLHKRRPSAEPVRRLGELDPERPPVERMLRAMAAAGQPSVVQFALTPAPIILARRRSAAPPRPEDGEDPTPPPSDLAGPVFYADVRLIGPTRALAAVAAELRVAGGANRLVGRQVGSARRRAYARRVARGEGNPLPAPLRRVYGAEEIACLWQLPSVGFTAVPYRRGPIPLAPAPAGILRVAAPGGLVADAHGPLTIHPSLRRQNTAVVGTVEQGKTSYLVASVRDDLRRDDCALIVLDPKGDAADAALSAVPDQRHCTVLDLARPTCGFNPLAVRAPVDAIADYVVAALRQLFADGEVRGSSDRYLRNALIGVLAYDRRASLWDVARLLEVGPAGVAFRARVAHRLATMPEHAEVASFLADELPGQLADARATTTAKLDAPANKLARVLNSASVKRVLVNDSLTIDFDRLIERREVLVVRGALGELGAGNVSVLMQLLVGMLDAALSRAQDRRGQAAPTPVALKIDEAPLVINPAFAQTLALKRSAGLETVACWQTDAQWPPELREQLDALFAHRVLFATASADDARRVAGLLMAEYSDQLRSGDHATASLAAPDVRLHLPRHTAIISWTTPAGRERPFIARTLPLAVDPDRIAQILERQTARGGRELDVPAPPPRLDNQEGVPPSPETGPRSPRSGPDRPTPPPLELGLQSPPFGPRHVAPLPGSAEPGRQSPPPGPERRGSARPSPDRGPESPPPGLDHPPQPPPGRQAPPAPGLDRPAPASPSREPPSPPSPVDRPPAPPPDGPAPPPGLHPHGPVAEPATYAELRSLDAATRVRWLPVAPPARRPALDATELELLGWIAAARCVLSSQAHRRLNPGRALTTTQRRLKRLADAGLLARFQLHGGDGGGVPFCCAATAPALALLELSGRTAPVLADDTLDALRRDVHTVGWLLALEARAGQALVRLLGPGRARLVPGAGGPADLDLGPGLHPRDFLSGDPGRPRRPVDRFRPLTPAAVAELRLQPQAPDAATDLVLFQEPAGPTEALALLERCDHLIAGWWRQHPRYARLATPPTVAILCANRHRAAALARTADDVLVACLARIGDAPDAWSYPARGGVHFVAEPDLHAGELLGWRVPKLVPALRSESENALRCGALLRLHGSAPGSHPLPTWR
jgi:hypothetical protein